MSNSNLRPTLRQLEYLVAVAEEGSFSAASTRCHVTQPSLSSQIRQLELLIGQEVFERTPRGVIPTPIGTDLINQAREVLASVDRFVGRAQLKEDTLSGMLRIGSVSTITPYLMPQVLAELAQDFPKLEIELSDDTADRLEAQLVRGEIDALVVPIPTGLGSCEELELAVDPFVLIAPAESLLGDLPEPVPVDALRQGRILLLDDPHCFRGHALEVCSQVDCSPDHTLHATSLNALVQLVRRGLGSTLLPALALELESGWLRELRIKRFCAPVPGRTIGLVWRKKSPIEADLRVLASILMRHAEAAVAWHPRPDDEC